MKRRIISIFLVLCMMIGMTILPAAAEDELPYIDVKTSDWFYSAVKALYEKGIMVGKSASQFAPNASMTRAEFVTMISRIVEADTTGCSSELEEFIDAKTSEWYSPSLGWAVREKLITGYNDKTVRPNMPILRQELAVLIVRFLNYIEIELPDNAGIESFTDNEDIPSWALKEIEELRRTGLSEGDQKGCFLPTKTATRAEVAELTERLISAVDNARVNQYDGMLPEDGTEYTYEGEMTEEAINSWIYSQAVQNNTHTSASVQNFESILEEFNSLNDGESKKIDITVQFAVNGYEITNTKTYKLTISKPQVIDPNEALAPNGTSYTYSGEITEAAFNSWILEQAASEADHDKAEVKEFSKIVEEYEKLDPGKRVALDVSVTFTILSSGITADRTYSITVINTEPDPNDPTPDNIGVAYEDASGLKISNVRRFENDDGTPIESCAIGVHGSHEVRIVRTDSGTYATYITYESDTPPEDHPLWVFGEVEFSIIKITATGFDIIYTDRYPRAMGSCAPNIFNGGDGNVYVTIVADDKDKYMSSNYTKEGAWLAVYELDTNTDTVTNVAKATPEFATVPMESHGNGYSMAIPDFAQGKIYALYNGGQEVGYVQWFIYDIKTRTWDDTCYKIQEKWRMGYPNAYADGNGGFYVVLERCSLTSALEEILGVDFATSGDTYIWDALYIYHIPDATKAEYSKKVVVSEPEYSATEVNIPHSVAHYGNGCTYLDNNGYLHIIYTDRLRTKLSTYHAVYDRELNEVKNELITFSRKNESSSNTYSFGMTQGLDGTYYIIAADQYSLEASIEVWSSTDGLNFTQLVPKQLLCTKESQTFLASSNEYDLPKGRIVIGNIRNNSVNDGIIPIMFNADIDGKDTYLYYSIELPQ